MRGHTVIWGWRWCKQTVLIGLPVRQMRNTREHRKTEKILATLLPLSWNRVRSRDPNNVGTLSGIEHDRVSFYGRSPSQGTYWVSAVRK